MDRILKKIYSTNSAAREEIIYILQNDSLDSELIELSSQLRNKIYGNKIFFRGLIEISNYCKNRCYYCGINCSNYSLKRYRLTQQDILNCCKNGYELGFRTFVLQGGEDTYFTAKKICSIVYSIKNKYTDCAVTLSIGEWDRQSYSNFYSAGADRYLLRHETANAQHYKKLHPDNMSFENRIRCLYNLKEIGFQTGAGFMVGSPYQTDFTLADDIEFLQKLKPHMVGIGPFIPHEATIFKDKKSGSLNKTLKLLALTRLILPNALLPATTALGSIDIDGRQKGILAGANVVMPNLSPQIFRNDYCLYNGKLCTDEESAEGLDKLNSKLKDCGFKLCISKGDCISG